jgi:subtilisin family serine protease
VARERGAAPKHVYRAALRGFAASLNAKQLERLRADPRVEAIEPDQEVTASYALSNATWGLDRMDQRTLPLSRTYAYGTMAANVRAYVIDTGLQSDHPEFGRRARNVYNAVGGSAEDCNGHGTHVAGTLGGWTYGVAKQVQLRGVKVLGCNGSGATSGIVAAVDWLRRNAVRPAVANMSVGGPASAALNTAVANLSASGVFTAVAAGNDSQDACGVSPAGAPGAFTTAASDSADSRAWFSNYGSCVETYAPGESITSAWLGGGTATLSGTSMASPHVAGVAALYRATYGNVPSSTIASWLTTNATSGIVHGNPAGTPNRLLYKGAL